MNLEESLHDIDNQLEAMPRNNRLALYAFVTVAIIGFIYYAFGINLEEEVTTKESTIMMLESKIIKSNPAIPEKKIAQEKKHHLTLAQTHQDEQYKLTALRTKLEKMGYLSTDAKGMAKILDRVLKESVRLNVNIAKVIMDKAQSEASKQIQKHGTITIEGSASFQSTLKLLRFIEAQEALIEVEHVRFDLDEKTDSTLPAFVITIIGYGIAL